jgi:ankyrin repeat protein
LTKTPKYQLNLLQNLQIILNFKKYYKKDDHTVDQNVLILGITALIWACQHREKALVEALLQRGANVNACQNDGKSPMLLAATDGCSDILKLLLEHGAVVPKEYSACSSMFHLAVRSLVLERLEQNKYGKTTTTSQDMAPASSQNRTFEYLDQLLANLQPDTFRVTLDSNLDSVLHYFAAINYARGIEKLASAPYNHPPDLTNKEGQTPVLIGIQCQSIEAVLQLLDFDIDVNRSCPPLAKLTPLQQIRKKLSLDPDRSDKIELIGMKRAFQSG